MNLFERDDYDFKGSFFLAAGFLDALFGHISLDLVIEPLMFCPPGDLQRPQELQPLMFSSPGDLQGPQEVQPAGVRGSLHGPHKHGHHSAVLHPQGHPR